MSKETEVIKFLPCGLWLSFDDHVVSSDVHVLLELQHTDLLRIFFINLNNLLVHPKSQRSVTAARSFGRAFMHWDPHIICNFTNVELHRLHRHFKRPSTDKLYRLLERANIKNVNADTWRPLSRVELECLRRQNYAQRPLRFKLTLHDDKDFNHTIYVDVFYIY